ncbi:GumC family protein [Laspinema olomoucense]|uniref:non-specific protein-tyrosine kinase n=1 Tax=Laspinema olomoucense D3b TaxID=2953688 RepID=A0ABT2N6T5_9CYAN|nr:tyrosine-protein kinase domain-containing protein [Laspinema sp. D3b]MCT7978393.1 polysaccharide biosynthesis tyrosine autokinase [Laspinema sp. D3b]
MDYDRHLQNFSSSPKPHELQHSGSLSTLYRERSEPSDEEKFDVAWLFAVFRRRTPIMLLVAISLSVMAGAVIVRGSRQTIPIYQGSFKLLVEPVTAEGRLARQYVMARGSGGDGDLQRARIEETSLVDYQTLIRVLKSPKLMLPAISKLQTEYPKLQYGSVVRNIEMTRITVGKGNQEQGTKILVVSYQDENPTRVEAVLNQLVETYLEYSVEERLASLRQGIQFIEAQLPALQEKVDTLQGDLQRLRQNYNLMDPNLADRYLSEHRLIIQRQRLDLTAQLQQQRTLYKNLQKQLLEKHPVTILSREAKAYENLIGQIQRLEGELAIQSAMFFDDSEPILMLREKLDNLYLQSRLAAESVVQQVGSEIEEIEAREQSLAEAEEILTQALKELPVVSRQYTDLNRELDVSTNTLQEFLARREALRVDAARNDVPWELIDPPVVPRDARGNPISITVPQTRRELAVTVILSILLAVGVGFLVEVLHTVFHVPKEIRLATKLPVVGVIPFAKELKKLAKPVKKLSPEPAFVSLARHSSGNRLGTGTVLSATGRYNSSPFVEGFRSLHTNVRLLSSNSPIHSLVIGSAEAGDGKSTVALHLAEAAAAIGQRVLLVDADLRSPDLHTRLELPNFQGLTDAISTDISLNDLIQRPPGENNLFVLTSGSVPDDPIKLLSSKKMHALMEQFQDFFDLVIYDTPPIVGLADGSILADQTDGLILVVGLAKTDRSSISKALEELKISGAPVLGVVANNFKRASS